MRTILKLAPVALLLLAGCDGDADLRRTTPATFSAFVADQACTRTSETATPVDANSLDLPDPQLEVDANAPCP